MSVTLADAQKLLAAAQAKAEELGVKMSMAVTDENGVVTALQRMDGGGRVAAEVILPMAFTSAAFRRAGADLMRLQELPFFQTFAAIHGGAVLAGKGSIPLRQGDQIVGIMVAAGGSEDQDEEVAKAGVAAF